METLELSDTAIIGNFWALKDLIIENTSTDHN